MSRTFWTERIAGELGGVQVVGLCTENLLDAGIVRGA